MNIHYQILTLYQFLNKKLHGFPFSHAKISPDTITYIGGQLDPVLHHAIREKPHATPDTKSQGTQDPHPGGASTGEEENVALVQAYNDFTKDLRSLKDVPLVMTSVQGISPSLRYTEVGWLFSSCNLTFYSPRSLGKNDLICIDPDGRLYFHANRPAGKVHHL